MEECTYTAEPWLLATSPRQSSQRVSLAHLPGSPERRPLPEPTLPPGSLSEAALALHPGPPWQRLASLPQPGSRHFSPALIPAQRAAALGPVPTPVLVGKPGSDYRPSETQIP